MTISDFVKVTNEEKHSPTKDTFYGTIKINDGVIYVQLDGSELLTPCTTSVNVKDGERVIVTVRGHEAVVTGNITSPAANTGDIKDAKVEIEQAVDNTLNMYDIKLTQMNELAANTLGFYYTEEKTDDGSIIAYRHNNPKLNESTIIYKSGIDGFFLSVDGGKTWKAGFDSKGDAVLNILYAFGINATYINTGELAGWTVNRASKKLSADYNGRYKIELDASQGFIYVYDNEASSVYVAGEGFLKGSKIYGDSLYSPYVKCSMLSASGNVTVSQNITSDGDISADGSISSDTDIKAKTKVIAGTHVEATGHFYCAGEGTDLADLSVRSNAAVGKNLNVGNRLTVNEQIYSPNMPTGTGSALYLTSAGFIKKSSSSKRYKKHVSFMEADDVEKLYLLRPVYFKYKEGLIDKNEEDYDSEIPGFYAELVGKYFPEAVIHNGKGQIEDWDPRKLIPGMLKLIQLQKGQLDRQEERLSKIESILNIKEN